MKKKSTVLTKITIILFFLFLSVKVLPCTFTIEMYDDYGDGWNGGKVTVYVNGIAVLSNITMSTGSGPVTQTFTVSTSDVITTSFTAGSYSYECSYYIKDANGTTIGSDGTGGTTPSGISTGITAQCPVARDASVVDIYASDCPGTTMVSVLLKNSGTDTLFTDSICWSIGGVTKTPVYWSDTLLNNESVTVSLDTFTFSAATSYSIVAWSYKPNNATDGNTSNDTFSKSFTFSATIINSFPYELNWEAESPGFTATYASGWTSSTSSNPRWECENSTGANENSSSTGPFYDHTSYGTAGGNYMYLETSGGSQGSTSYLTSPCIDLSVLTSPVIEFWYHMYGASMGTLEIEQQVAGNWVSTGWSKTGQQQTTGNAAWIKAVITLNPSADRLRFKGVRGNSYTGDMSIDDIKIYQPVANDLLMLSWQSPGTGHPPSTAVEVKVQIFNDGYNTQDTFIVKYSVNGGTSFTTENCYDSIQSGDTLTYTFATKANMNSTGFYNCIAVVDNGGDANRNNDTLTTDILICSALSGVYSIGPDAADDYANISEAVIVLNSCGVSGPVTLNIDSGTYNGQYELGYVTGSSSTNTITFKGIGNQTVLLASPTTADRDVITLDGAKYITFDSIKIKIASSASAGCGIRLMNGADTNTIRNCIIENISTTSSYYNGIVASNSKTSYSTGGNTANYLTIDNNTFSGGYYGIRLNGNSSIHLIRNVITNNNITNHYYSGIYNYYADSSLIKGNFIQDDGTNYGPYGIYAYRNYKGSEISYNKVQMNGTSAGYGLYVYYCEGVHANYPILIHNNMIMGTNAAASGSPYGIYAYYGKNVCYYYNSVNLEGGGTNSRAMYVYGSTTSTNYGNIKVKNNILSNMGSGYAMYFGSTYYPAKVTECNYNNLYTKGTNLAYYSGAKTDLAAWKASSTGLGANSVSVDPTYYSSTNLHTSCIPMNDKGSPITLVTDDIDNETRHASTPDIGADEYTPAANDLAITEIIKPLGGCGTTSADTVKIKLINLGTASQSNFTVKYSIDSGQTYTSQTISGPLTSLSEITHSFSGLANLATPGTYDLLVEVDITNDQIPSNDIKYARISSIGTITAPFAEGFENDNKYLQLFHGDESNSFIDQTSAKTGTYGLHLEGKTSNGWSSYSNVTQAFANTSHVAKALTCNVNAVSNTGLKMRFDMKQNYTYNTTYGWFRVIINDTMYLKNMNGDSVHNASTASSDLFTTYGFDLTPWAGTQFTLSLESACKYNADNYGSWGDEVFIDNIYILENIEVTLPNDTSICPNSTIALDAGEFPDHTSYKWYSTASSTVLDTNRIFTVSTAATYYVVVKDEILNYSDRDTITIAVHTAPTAQYVSDTIGVCSGDSVQYQLVFSGKSPYVFEYSIGNNTFQETSTTSTSTYYFNSANLGSQFIYLNSVTDANNCTTGLNDSMYVAVYDYPTVSFVIDADSQCLSGNSYTFTNYSTISSGSITYNWDYDDGSSSSSANGINSYNASGSYDVKLLVTSDKGCKDSVIETAWVHPMPVADYGINAVGQCLVTNNYQFTNTSTTTGMSYLWDFGDGATSSLENSTHVFTLADTFLVKLTIIDSFACKDSVSKSIYLQPNPIVDFTINDIGQCFDLNDFQFTNTTTQLSSSPVYYWDYGDGNSDNTLNGSNIYASVNTFDVKLIVSSGLGCSDSIIKTIDVFANPLAGFSINKVSQCLSGNNFIFNNTTSLSAGILSYNWNFGDGKTDTSTTGLNTYSVDGSYTITLIATSDKLCTDTITNSIVVYPQPVSDFTIDSNSQCFENNYFMFTNNSSISSGSISYIWDMGDGTVVSDTHTSRVYLAANEYDVKLVVSSDKGCRDSTIKKVMVNPMPVAGFIVNDSTQCLLGNHFVFSNTSTVSSGNLSYSWDFGDGSVSSVTNGIHAFSLFDTFTVKLLSISNHLCKDSIYSEVYVYPMPVSAFTIDDNSQCLKDNQIKLTNSSTIPYGSITYLWAYGDGNLTVIEEPVYSYQLADTFYVDLISTSDLGCIDTTTDVVYIFPMPVIDLGNNINMLTKDSASLNAGSGFVSYLWDDASSYQYRKVMGWLAGIGTHTYYVTVTDDNSCQSTDSIHIIIEFSSLTDQNGQLQMSVFPNPAKENFYLNMDGAVGNISLIITDLNGKEVYQCKIENYSSNFTEEINIGMLAKGVYLVKVINNQSMMTQKLIVR